MYTCIYLYCSGVEIKFSQVHGPKINLLDNITVASRYEGYCYSGCVSDRPLHVGETLQFNISETESGWMANMNVGILYTDPADLPLGIFVSCAENISIDVPNSEVFVFRKFYSKNNIYQFHVDKHGMAYLTPNVTDDDVIFTGVNVSRKFWALFNVYGDAKAVKLLGTSRSKADNSKGSWTSWLYDLLF